MRPARRKLRRLAAGLGLAAALPLVLIVDHALRHDARRADILHAAATSPASAAALIAGRFGARHSVCHPPHPQDDIANLVSALFALERFAVSPLEADAERIAVRASRWLGFWPPDLSYGVGQIRLSRALMLSHGAGARGKEALSSVGARTAQAMAVSLLDPCRARDIAAELVGQARRPDLSRQEAASALSRAQIMRLAEVYNAQAAPETAQAALAHRLYTEITYHLTLHYRYGARPQGAAE